MHPIRLVAPVATLVLSFSALAGASGGVLADSDTSPVAFVWSATGGPDGMRFPNDMALDPQGRLWVADTGNSRFAIFDPDGTFVESWGAPGQGDGQFRLEQANGGFGAIAFAPDGSFYVLDVGNKRVQHFAADRSFLGSWGSFGVGPGQYAEPIGLAVDGEGSVYVLDDQRGVIERYRPDGTVVGAVNAYPGSTTSGHDISASAFTIDASGDLYTSTIGPLAPSQVQQLDPTGTPLVTFGSTGSDPGQFSDQPSGAAVDDEGRLFVTQGPTGNGANVQVFGPDGRFLGQWRTADASGGTFDFPFGILLDGEGNVYVADAGANRVDKFRLLPPFGP